MTLSVCEKDYYFVSQTEELLLGDLGLKTLPSFFVVKWRKVVGGLRQEGVKRDMISFSRVRLPSPAIAQTQHPLQSISRVISAWQQPCNKVTIK